MNSYALKILADGLTVLANDPQMIGRVLDQLGCMPNLETKTGGGAVFWEDLANVDGWRVQRNSVFGNCRILDPQNVRRAWGGERAVLDAFASLADEE